MSSNGARLWVEILSRHDEVVARHPVQLTDAVRIGRGYDNDVILDDPYVAPCHLRIARDEGGALVAQDLGSANGLFVGEDRRRVERVVLDGSRPIRIGRTRLRIREASHAVAPERISRPHIRLWPLAAVLAAVVLGVRLLSLWLRETSGEQLGEHLGTLLMMCAMVAAWTSAWAVLSRIFSGRTRFERHLLIALSGLLVLLLVKEIASYAAFAFSQRELFAYRYVVQWLVGTGVVFLHLRQLSLTREIGRRWLKLKAGAVAALALLAIGMQTLTRWEASEMVDRESFLRGLKPPALRLARPQTESGFFADVAILQGKLDRARAEQPGRVWDFPGDDEN